MTTGNVVPFPAARRVNEIQYAAYRLVEGVDREAKAYWSLKIDDMTHRMAWAGISTERIHAELGSFANAVLAEVIRISTGSFQPWPDGGDTA